MPPLRPGCFGACFAGKSVRKIGSVGTDKMSSNAAFNSTKKFLDFICPGLYPTILAMA